MFLICIKYLFVKLQVLPELLYFIVNLIAFMALNTGQ